MPVAVSQKFMARSALLALSLLLIGFTGCRSDRVAVDEKDPYAPKYAYRKDELALLQMSADDIQELERKKQYGTIYDDYASQEFQKSVGRRQFLIMANCVESFLGGLQEYDRNDIGFRRETVKDKSKTASGYIDVLNRKVQRALGNIEEQLVFAPNGLSFKLNGLYWISKDKVFLQCIAQSGALDAKTSPQPETPPEAQQSAKKEETTSPSNEPSQTNGEAGSGPSTPAEPAQGQGSAPTGTSQKTDTQAPIPSGGLNTLESKPIQNMKPAEIEKAPLKARPPGAGAVVDQRPTPKKTKAEKQAEEEAAKRRIEPAEPTEMVPLPTTGGSDD